MTLKIKTLVGFVVLVWSAYAWSAPGLGAENAQPDVDATDSKVAVVSPEVQPSPARGFSYDYLHLGWVVNSRIKIGGNHRYGDGLDFRASYAIGDYFFIQGSSLTPDYRDSALDVTFGDWIQAGPGVHIPLIQGNYPLDIWGQVSYNRLGTQGLATTGFGLAGGLRFAPTPRLELAASVRYANTDGDALGANIDVDPLIYKIEALYYASPRIGLTVGYRGGTYDVDGAGLNQDVDISQFTVGLRYNYAVESDDLPPLPEDAPTPYNYAQVSYVVDGEVSGSGSDIDNDGGFGIEASALLSDFIFVRGSALTLDYDLNGVGTDAVLSDMAFIGPGMRYGHAIGPIHADIYGQVTYDRLVVADTVADGYGGEVGARFLLVPGIEFDAWYRAGVTQFSGNNNADPLLYGLRLILSVPNQGKWSNVALVVDYMDGKVKFDQPVLGKDNVDISALSVGLRATF